jgi:hypothetical protein
MYLAPLAQLAKMGVDKKTSQESVKTILGFIEKIYKVNQKLYEDICIRLSEAKDVDTMLFGDIFVNIVSIKCFLA